MVKFGDRSVGDGHPCFITFEAGPTHDGLESAKKLVACAAESGADAIKFQVIDPDRLVADKSVPFSYDVLIDRESGATETVTEPLYDILCRRVLNAWEWKELKQYSDSLGLAFFATICFPEEIDMLVELGCHSIKIASADVNHVPLLRKAARSNLCLQFDTGNATIGEIEAAIDIIREEGNENVIIHHCPSGYPARIESINLRIIRSLRQMFAFPIGFSDHSPGWDMDVAAVVIGANLVEKTISLDRTTPSIEHIMSLEPSDTKQFVQVIRDLEQALGSPRRILHPAEKEKRQIIRRSVHALEDMEAGRVLAESDFDYRRPGDGIPPSEVDVLVRKTLKISKFKGDRIEWTDINL